MKKMKDLRKIKVGGVTYGQVRDFMIGKGVLNMFKTGQIANPIKVASGLITGLLDLGVVNGMSTLIAGREGIFRLITSFFDFMNIKGFNKNDPNNLKDKNLQAAFA